VAASSVSILIPTHDRGDILAITLESLSQVRMPPDADVELIVIANACTDDTVGVVERAKASMPFETRCVEEPKTGLNLARNRAISESRGAILAFLDDDVWVESDWLVELLSAFDRLPADIVGGRVTLWWKDVEPPAWLSRAMEGFLSANDRGERAREIQGPVGAIGANVAVHRRVFDRVGPFQPGLDRTGKEMLSGGEIELLIRAHDAGFRLWYVPEPSVRHWVAPHRATREYVCRVAFGNARSRVFLKARFGPRQLARSLCGNTYLLLRHAMGEVVAILCRDQQEAMRHRTLRITGCGALVGVWQRLTGRSPLRSA
jgi:glycosyltransferase involved in cell wall biosynthesis